MKYFSPPFTDDHLKSQFRELSKKLHPDKGGDPGEFQKMKEERDRIETLVKAWRANKKPVIRRNRKPKKAESRIIIINLNPEEFIDLVRDAFSKITFLNHDRK